MSGSALFPNFVRIHYKHVMKGAFLDILNMSKEEETFTKIIWGVSSKMIGRDVRILDRELFNRSYDVILKCFSRNATQYLNVNLDLDQKLLMIYYSAFKIKKPRRLTTLCTLQKLIKEEKFDTSVECIRNIVLHIFKYCTTGSIEHIFLGLLVTSWKMKNNIPTIYKSLKETYECGLYSYGDYSNLDLSNLDFSRVYDPRIKTYFKAVLMKNANLVGCNFEGVKIYGWSVQGSDMSHGTFTGLGGDETILEGADISNAYFGPSWIPDRRAINWEYYRK